MINRVLDVFIKKEAINSLDNITNIRAQNIVFIDINNETYKSWNEPLITPRDKLAELINAAYRGGAKVIVVDILLEKKDDCNPQNDQKLRNILESIKNERASTTVILAARLRKNCGLIMPIFIDGVMEDGISLKISKGRYEPCPNVRLAIPYDLATSTDQVLRYWGSNVGLNKARRIRLLNMASLAAHLAKNNSEVNENDTQVDTETLYRNRIRFFLIPPGIIEKGYSGNLGSSLINAGTVRGIIPCKDKIVIIGNSHDDSGDVYTTPIGEMPGMYVLGNALNTIYLGMQPSPTPMFVNILIETLVIIMAAYVFIYFPALLAQIISSVILILTFGVLSIIYFYYTGTFLNFVFSVAGMGFHRTFSNIEDIFRKKDLISK
jgi:hypothetical protein